MNDDLAALTASELESPDEDQDIAQAVSRDLDRAFDVSPPWREVFQDLQLTDDVTKGWRP
ncbi:MAG TPA: hypothetical protein VMX94_10350 [Armatimonadota bacterium]|nr:hypothetical protein [Armatimonadota bacterium]